MEIVQPLNVAFNLPEPLHSLHNTSVAPSGGCQFVQAANAANASYQVFILLTLDS